MRCALLASFLLLVSCALPDRNQEAGAHLPLAIEHVTVVPMSADGRAPYEATVILRDGRIESIAPASQASVPVGARRIDARGKWLMPALADCHVHVENDRVARYSAQDPSLPDGTVDTADLLKLYVANGVLQIANLGAMSEAVGQRVAVESGRILGPHMMLAAMIDGVPPVRPGGFARTADTPEQGRQAVRDAKAEGYDQIKTYSNLKPETFADIVDEARRHDMKVVGHIPARGQELTAEFFRPGFSMVAHAEEYAYQSKNRSDADIERFVQLAKRHGTGLISTLSLNERIVEQTRSLDVLKSSPHMRYVHPVTYRAWIERNQYAARASPERIVSLEAVVAFNRRIVQAFVQAGIPVLAGTDSFLPGMVAGFALHDELEALVRAGMTNEQALVAATRLPAEWLGVSADRGTIEAGRRADLLLLDADPLADVRNTRRIAAVIAGTRYLPRRDLDAMLEALAQRHAAMQERLNAARQELPR